MEVSFVVPELSVGQGLMIGHRTRMLDSWRPQIERIILPAVQVPAQPVTVTVRRGSTASLNISDWTRHPLRRWRRRVSRWSRRIVDDDRLIFDARWDSPWNVYHVLMNVAVRVLLAREYLAKAGCEEAIHVVLAEHVPGYVRELYRVLGIATIVTDEEVTGRLVGVSPFYAQPIAPGVFSTLPLEGGPPTPDRVFIARRGRRTIANQEAVQRFLESRGFTTVHFEDIPAAMQAQTLRHASSIVAVHGAALGYLSFAMHRPSLVELFGPGYIVSCFRDLAAAVGSRWCGVRGQITPEVVRDLDHRHRHPRSHTTSPAVIDLASLEAALDRVSPLAASQPADDAVAIHPLFTAAPV